MITLRHIKIYKSFMGDGDGFIRSATKEEKAYMDYEHWSKIDDLIQDIRIINSGLASKDYAEVVYKKTQKYCDSEETIKQLEQLANGNW